MGAAYVAFRDQKRAERFAKLLQDASGVGFTVLAQQPKLESAVKAPNTSYLVGEAMSEGSCFGLTRKLVDAAPMGAKVIVLGDCPGDLRTAPRLTFVDDEASIGAILGKLGIPEVAVNADAKSEAARPGVEASLDGRAVGGPTLQNPKQAAKQDPSGSSASKQFIWKSKVMDDAVALVKRVAPTPSSVLILGESGTGKELVARMLHDGSDRRDKPFVALNCGAIPEQLMESELFGHSKGSFTGATKDKKGLFEAAGGGTIFLDEIGELTLGLQVKLLRVLQERVVTPVGETREVPVDVRVVAATHRNLEEAVQEERFRQDLYFRLNVIEVRMPPLRERKEDILPLAQHFLAQFSQRLAREIRGFEPEAEAVLQNLSYPGNVRELENLVERAVALEPSGCITKRSLHRPDHSPDGAHRADRSPMPESPPADSGGERPDSVVDFVNDAGGGLEKIAKITKYDKTWSKDKAARALHSRMCSGFNIPADTAAVLLQWLEEAKQGSTAKEWTKSNLYESLYVKLLGIADANSGTLSGPLQAPKLEATTARLHSAQPPKWPDLGWIQDLKSLVADGTCVEVAARPGNVGDLIKEILREAGHRVIGVNVANMDTKEAVANAVHPQLVERRAERERIVVIVRGLAQLRHYLHGKPESFTDVVRGINGLAGDDLVTVVVSLVHGAHLNPGATTGSMHLGERVACPPEPEPINCWASDVLDGIPPEEMGLLLELAHGQVDAISRAAKKKPRGFERCKQAIVAVHSAAADEIMKEVGPCCEGTLLAIAASQPGDAACVLALREAGVLTEDGHPANPAWLEHWQRTTSRKAP